MSGFDMPASGSWEVRGGWVVRRLMQDLGLTAEQAAGLVGNLGFESGGFTALQEFSPVGGGPGGYGWAQWTGPRRRAFLKWCAEHDLAQTSDGANYGYLLAELTGKIPDLDYRGVVEHLKQTSSLSAAVWGVGQTYERPGGTTPTSLPGYDERLHWAQRALNGAQQPPAPTPAPTPAPGPSEAVLDLIDSMVVSLQAAINVAGQNPPLDVDGILGPRTLAAYRQLRG